MSYSVHRRSVRSGAPFTVDLGLALVLATALSGCGEPPSSGWAGYVEGEYVYVSAPVAGTLTTLSVSRGQTVAAGAALFRLDDSLAGAAREESDARLAAARAEAADATKGRRRDEIAVIRAQLQQARAQAERAQAELAREQALRAQDFISRSRLDDARLAGVLNWMLATYGAGQVAAAFPPFTAAEVSSARRQVLVDRRSIREQLLEAMRDRGLLGPAEDGFGRSAEGRG